MLSWASAPLNCGGGGVQTKPLFWAYLEAILKWPLSEIREGGVREGGVAQICRKLRAKFAQNCRYSFRTSEEGAQNCRKFVANLQVHFGQFCANTPFPMSPSPNFCLWRYELLHKGSDGPKSGASQCAPECALESARECARRTLYNAKEDRGNFKMVPWNQRPPQNSLVGHFGPRKKYLPPPPPRDTFPAPVCTTPPPLLGNPPSLCFQMKYPPFSPRTLPPFPRLPRHRRKYKKYPKRPPQKGSFDPQEVLSNPHLAPRKGSIEPQWKGFQNHRQGCIKPFASNPPFSGYPLKTFPIE